MAILVALGCSQNDGAPPAAASGSPSAVPEPLAPAPSAASADLVPFAEQFVSVELQHLPGAVLKLPAASADIPREAPVLRGPQYPFKSLTSGSGSLCGVTHSGSARCFGGALDGKGVVGWTSVASGDDFAVGITFGGKLESLGNSPLVVPAGTPVVRADAGSEAGASPADAALPEAATKALGSGVRSVAASGKHFCAVRSTGGVQCHSHDTGCDLTPPEGLSAGSLVVGSRCFACATSGSGVQCWGTGAPVKQAAEKPSQLVSGDGFVCGLVGERAKCWGREAPDSAVKQLAAAGSRLCWLDAASKLACAGEPAPSLGGSDGGSFKALAVTQFSTCAADETGYWRCQGASPPVFDYWKANPSWGPTAEAKKQRTEARRALLTEFAARFTGVSVPVEFRADTKLKVGPQVETKYLPLLQNVGLDWPLVSDERTHRYGFRIDGLKGGTYLALLNDFRVELFAFNEAGELKGTTLLAGRGPYEYSKGKQCLTFNGNDAVREEWVTSTLDERGILKVQGQRSQERMEHEPIQKKDIYQCNVLTAALTLSVTGKAVANTPLGWKVKKNEIGGPGCDAHWPLNVPFFVQDGTKRLGGPALSQFSGGTASIKKCSY